MWGLVLWTILLMSPLVADAHQVCFQRATGRLLEYQSHATPGTCTKNLLNAGIPAADIEEREVTLTEWQALQEEHLDAPARAKAEHEAPIEIPVGTFGGMLGGALAALGVSTITGRKKKEPLSSPLPTN